MSSMWPGGKRKSILEDVYEDNVRINEDEPAPRTQKTGDTDDSDDAGALRVYPWLLLGTLVLVMAGAVGWAYQQGTFRGITSQISTAETSEQTAAEAPENTRAQGRSRPFIPERSRRERPRSVPLQPSADFAVAGVFGLSVKTIVIDAGHGGKEKGAVGPAGTKEKYVTLNVARRLRRRLEERYGYRVLMTRKRDVHVTLRERVAFANRHEADLFVSIHINSLPVERVTSVETYYYGTQASDQTLRLARKENKNSGYSVSEFNTLLETVGQTMRRQESRRLATAVQRRMYKSVKEENASVRNWGVRTAPFVVLLGVEAPSILAEIAVISNRAEEQKLRRASYRKKLARFLERGIVDYLKTKPVPDSSRSSSSTRSSSSPSFRTPVATSPKKQ